ncbi:MAG: selenoprotein B, partial [Desulfobulbia bacterium]
MGGLAHYIEAEGIPTVIISLLREHTERMKPPRGLAVPFELGRPFGAANEPDFQRRVLHHALTLLERTEGPVLEDFPDKAPGASADMEGWTCPVNLAAPKTDLSDNQQFAVDLKQEVSLMRPWYEESVRKQNGRRLNGLTELDPDEIVDFLTQFLETPEMDSIVEDLHVGRAVKLTSDDLKYFYYQA